MNISKMMVIFTLFAAGITTAPAQTLGEVTVLAHDGNAKLLQFGHGYDIRKNTAFKRECVKITTTARDNGGDAHSTASYSLVSSRKELAEAKGMSGGLKAGVNLGIASVGGGFSAKKTSKHRIHAHSKAIVARKVIFQNSELLKAGTVSLLPKYLKLLNESEREFRKKCGDGLVYGRQRAADFTGLATMNHSKSSSTKKKSQSHSRSGRFKIFEASVSVDSDGVDTKELADLDLTVTIEQSGTKTMKASSIRKMIKTFDSFDGKNRTTQKLYRAFVVPYSELVNNWPEKTDGFPDLAERNISDAVDKLWDVEDLIIEAGFITDYQDFFALGIEKKTRKRALLNLKKQSKAWLKTRDKLAPLVERCSEGKTADCKKAAKIKVDVDKMRAQLPERYSADCKNIASEIKPKKANEWVGGDDKEGGLNQDLVFKHPKGKGKKKKNRKRLHWTATPTLKDGLYNLSLKVKVRKDWLKKRKWHQKLRGKKKNKFITVWTNYDAPIDIVTENLRDLGLGECRFKSKPKKITAKTKTFGSKLSKKEKGIKVACDVGKKHLLSCNYKYRLSDIPLPNVHVADLEMETLFGPKGSKRMKLNQKMVQKRLKKIKARKAKLNTSKAAKKRKARKAKRKKTREARLKILKKVTKCKKGKKGKKCRQKRKKKKGKKKK